MNELVATLTVGARLRHDGETFQVVDFAGRRITLQSAGGRERQVEIGWLLGHASTELLGARLGQAPLPAVGPEFAALTEREHAALAERAAHVREVLSGYRSGSAELAAPDEPRPIYDPAVSRMARYRAKAAELGVDERTVRRWVKAYQRDGAAGLLDGREVRKSHPLAGMDPRWLDMCRTVLEEHTDASRPTHGLVLARVAARLEQEHGPGRVPVPGRSKAYAVLAEITRGTNAFTGSTKGKRSIANRPVGVYGKLRATRPGEYLLLDTTRLDVFAMEPVTLQWVGAELTIAIDLYSRCIAGLRLTPVSTKSVDAAAVLFEALRPPQTQTTGPFGPRTALTAEARWPYHGVPRAVVVDANQLADQDGQLLLPSAAAETIVVDHGKIYVSEHLTSVCARLGISIQPARPDNATDKAAVERFFRTLREGLLQALPGYKGPDVYSRGRDVEDQAFYFLDELELIIRQWVGICYHTRPHEGLVVPEVPGLEISPNEMYEHGVERAGFLQVLPRADLVYDFLPVEWRTIQHYGVEINGLRYNGPALTPYRNRTSPHTGVYAGKWPLRLDDDDIAHVYFQDPADNCWHVLVWEHAESLDGPFSREALAYARRLAAGTERFPDDLRAIAGLLERWDAGLIRNPTERRMAVRISQHRAALVDAAEALTPSAADDVRRLPTVQALAFGDPPPAAAIGAGQPTAAGDDDDERDLAAEPEVGLPDVPSGEELSDEEFYAEAMRPAR
jgi:transposase InsO family protein